MPKIKIKNKSELDLEDFEKRIAAGEKLSRAELKEYRSLDKKVDTEAIHGYTEAAQYCKLSKRTLSYHLGRGSLQQNPDGTFDKKELDRFLKTKDRREKSPKFEAISKRKDAAELRYRLARARREEMLVEQMKGNLASWKEIHTEWSQRVQAVTAGLNALPDRLTPIILGKSRDEIRLILQREFKELLTIYSRVGKTTPEGEK
jgi:hypothetical protein